jgi:hypothetical protein
MAAMATLDVATAMQSAQLVAPSSLSSRFGPLRLGRTAMATARPARSGVVRAAGNPERIDKFVEGAKSDASKNAKGLGDAVAKQAGEVENTIKDVGRDMGAKAQEAVDAATRKADEAGDKVREVGDEVSASTKDTLNAGVNTHNPHGYHPCIGLVSPRYYGRYSNPPALGLILVL